MLKFKAMKGKAQHSWKEQMHACFLIRRGLQLTNTVQLTIQLRKWGRQSPQGLSWMAEALRNLFSNEYISKRRFHVLTVMFLIDSLSEMFPSLEHREKKTRFVATFALLLIQSVTMIHAQWWCYVLSELISLLNVFLIMNGWLRTRALGVC